MQTSHDRWNKPTNRQHFLVSGFTKNKYVLYGLGLSLFLNILSLSLLILRIFPQPDQVVIHYNIYFGADRIGPAWQAAYLPVLGLIILIANFLAGWFFWDKNKTLSYSLVYLSSFLSLMILVATIFLVLANL